MKTRTYAAPAVKGLNQIKRWIDNHNIAVFVQLWQQRETTTRRTLGVAIISFDILPSNRKIWNIVFAAVHVSKKKNRRVGGRDLANTSFSRIYFISYNC